MEPTLRWGLGPFQAFGFHPKHLQSSEQRPQGYDGYDDDEATTTTRLRDARTARTRQEAHNSSWNVQWGIEDSGMGGKLCWLSWLYSFLGFSSLGPPAYQRVSKKTRFLTRRHTWDVGGLFKVKATRWTWEDSQGNFLISKRFHEMFSQRGPRETQSARHRPWAQHLSGLKVNAWEKGSVRSMFQQLCDSANKSTQQGPHDDMAEPRTLTRLSNAPEIVIISMQWHSTTWKLRKTFARMAKWKCDPQRSEWIPSGFRVDSEWILGCIMLYHSLAVHWVSTQLSSVLPDAHSLLQCRSVCTGQKMYCKALVASTNFN